MRPADKAELVLRALRTGEVSTVRRAASLMAAEVHLSIGGRDFIGKERVVHRLEGVWPETTVFRSGIWESPIEESDAAWVVNGRLEGAGGGLRSGELRLSFDASGTIDDIKVWVQHLAVRTGRALTSEIMTLVNNALSNDTPMVVGAIDERGRPMLSLRGSVQCFNRTMLCLWSRDPCDGLITSLHARPDLTLLYRDGARRTALRFSGQGHLVSDPEVRSQIYWQIPEIERHHDLDGDGNAALISLDEVIGTTSNGPVKITIERD